MEPIPFFLHDLGDDEVAAAARVVRTPLLTTGPVTAEFESGFSDFLGVEHTVAVASCTAGLHLALEGLGIGSGDEVIVPNMTFAASALAVQHAGATPVLVDVRSDDGTIDLDAVRSAIGPRTAAIMPVHLYGQMCDMRAIAHLAGRHGLAVVEDAAHCIEGERDGVSPGDQSDAACFSFYATKNITCGEGGAVATRHGDLASALRRARTHGMTRTAADRMHEGYKPWDIVNPGWKYNLDDIRAAMLLPQIGKVWDRLRQRSVLAKVYDVAFQGSASINLPTRTGRHAHHLYPIWIEEETRESCMQSLTDAGIGWTVNYAPISTLSTFSEILRVPGDVPVSRSIGARTLSLPMYPSLSTSQAERVAQCVLDCVR